jgi:hypothetical protein
VAALFAVYQLYFERLSLYTIWFVVAVVNSISAGKWGAGESYFATAVAASCILTGLALNRVIDWSELRGRSWNLAVLTLIPILLLVQANQVFHMPTHTPLLKSVAAALGKPTEVMIPPQTSCSNPRPAVPSRASRSGGPGASPVTGSWAEPSTASRRSSRGSRAWRAERPRGRSDAMHELDLEDLGLDEGGHLLLKRALASIAVGERLRVSGSASELALHLATWCRAQGHRCEQTVGSAAGVVERGSAQVGRWRDAERTGAPDPSAPGAVADAPPARWGLTARGAALEAGAPDFDFRLCDKDVVWADDLQQLYRQAAAAQWDPEADLPWDTEFDLPDEVEDAVVQVMTYLNRLSTRTPRP